MNSSFSIKTTLLSGLLVIDRPNFADDRGFFKETFRIKDLEEATGRKLNFVQQNHSRSQYKVLRGLHAENWDKLVYVSRGSVFSAIVDLRLNSPTFAKHETFQLGEENRQMLFIPSGLANSFCVLSDWADYIYLVTSYYDGFLQLGLAWNDPDIGIQWPFSDPILSEKDRNNPTLKEFILQKLDQYKH